MEWGSDRRTFLKRGLLAAGSLALGSIASPWRLVPGPGAAATGGGRIGGHQTSS